MRYVFAPPRLPKPLGFGLVVLALITLQACSQKKEDTAETPPQTPVELTFAKTNADAEVTLALPEAIKAYPELHARLYTEGETDLKAFIDQAARDRKEIAAAGSEPPPYFRSITWQLPAQSARLVSVYAEMSDYTGGAHPNSAYQTVIWDKTLNTRIDARTLFAANPDLKAADTYLCRQIEAERSKRAETPTTQAATGFTCPRLIDSQLALVPSTTEGKIGALEVLFAPYDVGPYAEGPYQIRVPQSLIRSALNPVYLPDFAGEPKPAPPASTDIAG